MLVSHFYMAEEKHSEAKITEMLNDHFAAKTLAQQLLKSDILRANQERLETEYLSKTLKHVLALVFFIRDFDYKDVQDFYSKRVLATAKYPLPGLSAS